MMETEIKSPLGRTYRAGRLLGQNDWFNVYECFLEDNRVCILKIARDINQNGFLDREAYILGLMRDEAAALEKEYAAVKKDDKFLNYHFFFPDLIESFIVSEQENRRANVLSFFAVAKDLGELVPLAHLAEREFVYVDPRTSAWILGKLLKLLVFTQSLNVTLGFIADENILINRSEHYVSIFDWTEATVDTEKLDIETMKEEIAAVTREVVIILGGDPLTGELPEDRQLTDDRYAKFLQSLINKQESDASVAHRKFYELIRSLWPRDFYPFTTKRITN